METFRSLAGNYVALLFAVVLYGGHKVLSGRWGVWRVPGVGGLLVGTNGWETLEGGMVEVRKEGLRGLVERLKFWFI